MNRSDRQQGLALIAGMLLGAWILTACGPLEGPATVVEQQLAEGKTVYETHCAACHGLEGEGQPNWRVPDEHGVYPAPPHDSSGHTWHHPDQWLLEVIAKGGVMPNSGMPGFEDALTHDEMEAALAYIKTFWNEEHREFQAEITERWEEMTGD